MTSSHPHCRTRNCRIGNRRVGHDVRVLTVVDVFSRECVALVARRQFRGDDVAAVLTPVLEQRGRPTTIQCHQGTSRSPCDAGQPAEFTSIAMNAWAYWQHIRLDVSRRGTPGDNVVDEAFNGSLRRECLSQHHFLSVEDAQQCLACGGRGLDWLNNGNTDHYLQRHLEPNAF